MVQTEQLMDLYAGAPLTFVDIVTQKMTVQHAGRPFVSSDQFSGLIVPLSGSATFSIGEESYTLEPGTLLHVGPNLEMRRNLTSDEPFEFTVIHFNLSADMCDAYPLFFKHFSIQTGDSPKLNDRVQQLLRHSLIPGRIAHLQSKGLFLNILEEMLSANEQVHAVQSENLEMVTQYMRQYYAKGISFFDVALHFKADKRRLSDIFSKTIGVSPNRYLTDLRIQQSKLLLRTSALSVAEVAETVGYRDHFYFSRVFKKETGVPPSHYRKRMG